jgi:hypothetical protein
MACRALTDGLLRLGGALTMVACLAAPAQAQGHDGFGLRGGATVDPNQVFFGAHYVLPLAGDFKIHPAAEVGFGDDLTLASIRIDFAQWFDLGRPGGWSFFFGSGPTINVRRYEIVRGSGVYERDLAVGADFVLGMAHEGGPMLQLSIGTSASPVLRVAVGYTFGR